MLTSPRELPSLAQRALEALRIVVKEHVRTGAPVSSRQVARLHPERLSPATIRNVMAELTGLGFLEQPHTSAGRVPTDKGYRAFVDEVLAHAPGLAPREARRIEEILLSSRELDQMLSRAGRLLGRMTKQVAMVVAPDAHAMVLEYADFVRVSPARMVAIFVGRGGDVLHRVVDLDEDLSQEDLDHAAQELRERMVGGTLPEARRRLVQSLAEDRRWVDRVGRRAVGALLRVFETPFTSAAGEVIVEGASRLFAAPELADANRLREVMRTIEEKARLLRLLDRCLAAPGVQVIIGSEAPEPGMAPVAVVASRYGGGEKSGGLVGVLGPRRMEYARAVALVDHFARTISAVLSGGAAGGQETQ